MDDFGVCLGELTFRTNGVVHIDFRKEPSLQKVLCKPVNAGDTLDTAIHEAGVAKIAQSDDPFP